MAYDVYRKLYESTVEPILLYGAPIWGLYGKRVISNIQNRACRFDQKTLQTVRFKVKWDG